MRIFKKKNIKLREGIDDSVEIEVPVTGGSVSSAIMQKNQEPSVKNASRGGQPINYKLTVPNSTKPTTATTYSDNINDAQKNVSSGNNTVIPQANTNNESKISKKKLIEKKLRIYRNNSVTFKKSEIKNMI
jgi:hypothetical protein